MRKPKKKPHELTEEEAQKWKRVLQKMYRDLAVAAVWENFLASHPEWESKLRGERVQN
jgi:hypothetical protein